MNRIFLTALMFLISAPSNAGECSANEPELFSAFVERFSSEKDFALKRTQLPLQTLKWEFGLDDKGRDAPTARKSSVSRSDYSNKLWLGNVLKENQQLSSRVDKVAGNNAVLEVFQPNTDWLVKLHFKRQKGCWFYWQYEDRSL